MTEATTSSTADERLLPFGLAFLGVALAAISLFLPYVDENSTGSFARVAENTIIQQDYGWANLIFIGLAVVGLVRNLFAPHRVIWPLILGGLIVASAVYAYVDEDSRTLCPIGDTSFSSACSVAEPGLGIYLLGAGGGALMLSGLFFLKLPPSEKAAARSKSTDPMSVTRECPHCKSAIRPDASVCPHCQRESTPWTLHSDNKWWRQDPDGTWFFYEQRQPDVGWHRFEGASEST